MEQFKGPPWPLRAGEALLIDVHSARLALQRPAPQPCLSEGRATIVFPVERPQLTTDPTALWPAASHSTTLPLSVPSGLPGTLQSQHVPRMSSEGHSRMHPGAQDRPRHPILNTTERLEQNDQTVNSQLRVLRGPHAHHHLPCKPPAPLRGGPVVLGNGTCLPHPALDLPVLPAKDNSSTGPPGPIPACLSQGQHSSNPPLISLGRQFSSLLGFLSGVKMHSAWWLKHSLRAVSQKFKS